MRLRKLINKKPPEGKMIDSPTNKTYNDLAKKSDENIRQIMVKNCQATQEAANIFFC